VLSVLSAPLLGVECIGSFLLFSCKSGICARVPAPQAFPCGKYEARDDACALRVSLLSDATRTRSSFLAHTKTHRDDRYNGEGTRARQRRLYLQEEGSPLRGPEGGEVLAIDEMDGGETRGLARFSQIGLDGGFRQRCRKSDPAESCGLLQLFTAPLSNVTPTYQLFGFRPSESFLYNTSARAVVCWCASFQRFLMLYFRFRHGSGLFSRSTRDQTATWPLPASSEAPISICSHNHTSLISFSLLLLTSSVPPPAALVIPFSLLYWSR
jgi:hypothetical protein